MKHPDFEVFVAADGAYAAFEQAVLNARHSIIAGFRVFDMRTALVSDAARSVGETWFDLLAHVVARGVSLDLMISDFDPVFAPELHRLTQACVRQGAALAEVAGVPQDRVHVRAALHPATPGTVPWLAFLPESMKRARLVGADGALPRLHPVTHHQKLAVIDDDTLYIGGLDLNMRRYDTPDHDQPAAQTWSDVQVLLRNDPAVAEARAHLETFPKVIADRATPPELTHIRRTVSVDRRFKFPFLSPRTVLSEIEEFHLDAFRSARNLIYIETQYMRSRVIAKAMADAARRVPDLSLILILPALPEEAGFPAHKTLDLQTRYGLSLEYEALEILREGFGPRATIATPVQQRLAAREDSGTRAGSPMIYVHNKVLIVDSHTAMVGSANLNGRSLRWDTEAALRITAPDRIDRLQHAVTRHWWRRDLPPDWRDPAQMQPLWQVQIARNNVSRPENRDGFLVSHDQTLHEAEGQPLPMVTDDIV